MSRIDRRFEQRRSEGRRSLITYITGGDPEPGATVPMMQELVSAGADIIEVGMPFSDPMADGPVIQAACERALAHGTGLRTVLDMVREFRRGDNDTPVVLMGYLNPVEQMGYETFSREAAAAGVDGVLIVDQPPEESEDLVATLSAHGLDPIWLVAPTTREVRLDAICRLGQGFIYYVSLKGVTGAANLDIDDVARHVAAIRSASNLPVGVGFGIHDAEKAARIAAVADAAVVGSAIVSRIGEFADDPAAARREVCELVSAMRQAMDTATRTPAGEAL